MSNANQTELKSNLRFAGKRVIVTGASAGIGKATAKLFASEGATVAIIARRKELLERIVKEELGGKGFAVVADYTDLAQVTRSIEEAAKLLGGIDVLVNNVGGIPDLAWFALPYSQQLSKLNSFNLDTVEYATEAALPFLIASKGAVINNGSITGLHPAIAYGAYGTAKAAVHHSSKLRALQLAGKGVTVNVVAPGLTETDIFAPFATIGKDVDKMLQGSRDRTPTGRNATPEEIAAAIAFFADKRVSGQTTGQVLAIDGGVTLDLTFNYPDELEFNRKYA